jgi:hypothetical protein
MNMKEITVTKPFTYYINGYEKQTFAIGKHEVPYDCAAYAEKNGCTRAKKEEKKEEKKEAKANDGADKPAGSEKASTN